MLRTLVSVASGLVLALVIATGTAGTAASAPSQPLAKTCYYACDTWTLYPTYEACFEVCPDPCERVCF